MFKLKTNEQYEEAWQAAINDDIRFREITDDLNDSELETMEKYFIVKKNRAYLKAVVISAGTVALVAATVLALVMVEAVFTKRDKNQE